MQYNDGAQLDTSGVQDTRGSRMGGGRGVAVGGGGLGIVGLLIVVLLNVVGGGGGDPSQITDILGQLGAGGAPATADNSQIKSECKTGADANTKLDCAIVADIDSIQSFWAQQFGSRYEAVPTVWFSGSVRTGCGSASSASGPFYCPRTVACTST